MFKQAPQTRPRLATDVYDQILSAIVNGEIKSGERLIQEKIAEQINISRTPVREALLRLEQEGILEMAGRKGFSIRQISDDEIRAMYGAREAVEGYSAFLLAEKKDPGALEAIAKTVETERGLAERDIEKEFQTNRDIHRVIVEQTGNAVLLKMFDQLWGRGISLWLFAATRSSEIPPKPEAHEQLLEVLSTGTPEQAQQAMIGHIRDGLNLHLTSS